jgi:hypothetical protein
MNVVIINVQIMLLSFVSFVKVDSGKAPALCGCNSGGLGVESHQCLDDGDEVVL